MALELSIKVDTDAFKKSLEAKAADYEAAFTRAKQMVASMIKSAVTDDIQNSGGFGAKYADAVTVEIEGNSIITTIDAPGASIFETGGTVFGNPLLWLPISGTDAVGIQARDYGDKLFSVNRKAGGPPLLFSVRDKAPKYFGVSSINQPKRFHVAQVQQRIMDNFADIMNTALGETNG